MSIHDPVVLNLALNIVTSLMQHNQSFIEIPLYKYRHTKKAV